MTFANIDTSKTATNKPGIPKTFGAAILGRINEYRAVRKERRKLYSHHTAKAAALAQAQRDVNRVWY